jgi:hypothetical protein
MEATAAPPTTATNGSTNRSLTTKVVTLSDGSRVTLQSLGWSGYRAFKNELIRLQSGPILTHVSKIAAGPMIARIVERFQAGKDPGANLAGWSSEDTAEVMTMLAGELQKGFALIIADLAVFIDTAGDLLLTNCLPAGFDVETLKIEDGITLRNEALALTDLETIWRLEKNFVGELGKKITALIGKAKSQPPHGISASSQL